MRTLTKIIHIQDFNLSSTRSRQFMEYNIYTFKIRFAKSYIFSYKLPIESDTQAKTMIQTINNNIPSYDGLLNSICVFAVVYALLTRKRRVHEPEIHFRKAGHFRPEDIPEHLDTIVIGSGIGASSCANLLAQSGQKVLVLEQHYVTGGCTHTFRKENCEFDTGLHYVPKEMSDATSRSGSIMNFMTKGKQKWTAFSDTEPYDEIRFPECSDISTGFPNESSYPFYSGMDSDALDEILNRIAPRENEFKDRMVTFVDICKDINTCFTALGISRMIPRFLRIFTRKKLERLYTYASMTTRDVQYAIFNLGYTKEDILLKGCPIAPLDADSDYRLQKLKAVLTHPIGDYAVQPMESSMAAHGVTMSHYMNGGSYTVGPTQNISVNLTSVMRSYGSEAFVEVDVKNIVIEKNRAVGVKIVSKDAKGNISPVREIRAKNIVCGTSVFNLYTKLLPKDHPVITRFYDKEKRTICQSNGHVFLFVKLRGDAKELSLPMHNLWYFNGYNLDLAFEEYFEDPMTVRPPTVYIGFPCTKDKTWEHRYPGTSNCILISDGLYEWFEKWSDKPVMNRGEDYLKLKQKLSSILLNILYEQVPSTKGRVEFCELGTPLSEMTYLSSYHGGSYGTKCTVEMFDEVNREWTTTPHTAISGLTLAGCDAFLPSVTGSMYGGVLGAFAVLGPVGTIRLSHQLLCHLTKTLQTADPSMSFPRAYYMALTKFLK
mmetsp:Transcript_8993/g.12794  ORF Transcript_8993/g.12794 Transcript_8993/m.12794 type:complete len:715 (-) Transcript_8993:40-2184(-)